MMRKLFSSLMLALIVGFSAGEARSQSVTNWGDSVEGIQLSITVSNSVVAVGSSIMLQCLVKNSTNRFVIFAGNPDLDMQIALSNESGQTYDLSMFPSNFRPGSDPGFGLQPGELERYAIPINLPKGLQSGVYSLKAAIKLRILNEDANHKMTFRFPMAVSNGLVLQMR